MKKLLVAVSITVLGSVSANAADLAVRPYTKAVPYVERPASWTGGYIGVNVGGGITHSPVLNDFLVNNVLNNRSSADLSSAGVIGGAQIGYNWQFSPTWVFGLEADIQGSNQKGTTSIVFPPSPPGAFRTLESRLDYFGTARARLGFLAMPSLLLYATGGFAWGETELNLSSSIANGTRSGSFNNTDTGWTVGAGIEGKISAQWSVKAEYLYLDLGNRSAALLDTTPPPDNQDHRGSVDFRDHVVRVGLNYHF